MPCHHISTPHKCLAGPRSGPTAEMNIRELSPLILFGPFILELSSVVYRCTLGIKIKAIHSFKIAHSESMCLGDNNCRNVALIWSDGEYFQSSIWSFWQSSAKALSQAKPIKAKSLGWGCLYYRVPSRAVPSRPAQLIYSLNHKSDFNQIFRVGSIQ